MLEKLSLKIAAGALGALLIVSAFLFIKDAFDDRAELRQLTQGILVETRYATDNPDLKLVDVSIQIKNLGEAYKELAHQRVVQNEAIDALGQERKQALDYAENQALLRKEVIEKSKELAKKLRTQSLTPVAKENLEAELRKVQDMAWELGL